MAGHDFEYPIRKAAELAENIATDPRAIDRVLEAFVGSEAKTVFPFARKLAECVPDPVVLFETALAKAEAKVGEPNRQLFAGMVAGADARDTTKARDCIRAALKSAKLKGSAISLIGSGTLRPDDLRLVVSLVRAGDVAPWQCVPLSYGRGIDHLSFQDVAPLLDELLENGLFSKWSPCTFMGARHSNLPSSSGLSVY
jgi:hypothetical protein